MPTILLGLVRCIPRRGQVRVLLEPARVRRVMQVLLLSIHHREQVQRILLARGVFFDVSKYGVCCWTCRDVLPDGRRCSRCDCWCQCDVLHLVRSTKLCCRCRLTDDWCHLLPSFHFLREHTNPTREPAHCALLTTLRHAEAALDLRHKAETQEPNKHVD